MSLIATVRKSSVVLLAAFTLSATPVLAEPMNALDPNLPQYEANNAELGAALHSVGSDSMGGLVELWVKAYRTYQPKTKIQVVSRGSASAPAALIEGTAQLGPMARPMKKPELKEFKSKYGFEPTQIRTAIAGVAVYVSKDNPLKSISFEQLDAIFSSSRTRGAKNALTTWGELGVTGNLADKPIMAVGAAQDSPASAYFRQQVLLQGNYNDQMSNTANTASMFDVIAANAGAIGFGTVTTGNDNVKPIAVYRTKKNKARTPTLANIANGNYPLGRFLNVYIVREPGKELDAATRDFLRFALSKNGQEIVAKEGLIPLPANIAREELNKIN